MKKGFSLVEILMGTALFAVLMLTVNLTLIDSLKSARRVGATDVVKSEGNILLSQMTKDIEFSRDIVGCNSATPVGSNTLVLTRSNNTSTTVTYSLVSPSIRRRIDAGATVTISSTGISARNYLPDCPTMFVCSRDFVTICFGADVPASSDLTDTASASGGLKFYNRVLRRNNI